MNLTFKELRIKMENCEQMKGLSVLEHGKSVYRYYLQLNDILNNHPVLEKMEWRFPKWFDKYREQINHNRVEEPIMYWYLTYHDCGKAWCLEIDENGKKHFPNHAERSYQIWSDLEIPYLSREQKEAIGQLILHDMDLHIMTAEKIEIWLEQRTIREAISLLLSALCEIHANAEMFGGISSDSFKAKFKKIERRGNQICQKLFGGIND